MHEQCIGCTEQNSGNDLNGRMAYKFFQFDGRKFLSNQDINGLYKFIDNLSLFAGLPANAHSIMADNNGKNSADGKLKGTSSAD